MKNIFKRKTDIKPIKSKSWVGCLKIHVVSRSAPLVIEFSDPNKEPVEVDLQRFSDWFEDKNSDHWYSFPNRSGQCTIHKPGIVYFSISVYEVSR